MTVVVGNVVAGVGDWQRSFISRYHALLSPTAAGTEPRKCDSHWLQLTIEDGHSFSPAASAFVSDHALQPSLSYIFQEYSTW